MKSERCRQLDPSGKREEVFDYRKTFADPACPEPTKRQYVAFSALGECCEPNRNGLAMAFRFKRKESSNKALHRLAIKRVQKILLNLERTHDPEAIHRARKDLKKLRSLIRLARENLKKSVYRRAAEALREAARELAPARDARVKLQCLDKLLVHFKIDPRAQPFSEIRNLVRSAGRQETRVFLKHLPEQTVERTLKSFSRELDNVRLREKPWPVIAVGIRWSYEQGSKAHKRALEKPLPKNLHEWRKRVKDFWHNVCLMRRIRPREMRRLAEELEELGECLGDDHDLTVLHDALKNLCPRDGEPKGLKPLSALIELRQRELRSKAFALGGRLYAERPSNLCRRLENYWKQWRSEPQRMRATIRKRSCYGPLPRSAQTSS